MVFLLLFSLSLSSSVFQCCDSHKTGLCEKDCGQHPGCCGFPGLVHPFYSFCLLTPTPLPTLPTPCHAGCYSMDRPVNCLKFSPSQLYWSLGAIKPSVKEVYIYRERERGLPIFLDSRGCTHPCFGILKGIFTLFKKF